jgi:peroxin-2
MAEDNVTSIQPWSKTWRDNVSKISGYDQSVVNSKFGGGVVVLRVNQLDALVLDNEVAMLLLQQFKRIFVNSHFVTRETYDAYEPEADLIVWLILYSGSILLNRPTPGNIFMSLKYRNNAMFQSKRSRGAMTLLGDEPTIRQRILWITLTAIVPYCWLRLKRFMQQWGWSQEKDEEDFEDDDKTGYIWHVWKHRFYNLCTIFESIYQMSRFINFILFLRVGEFRSLVDRILQMRLVYSRDASTRALSFEYLNRDLLLNSAQDFALFLMPILNFGPAIRSASRGIRQFGATVGHVTGIRKRKKNKFKKKVKKINNKKVKKRVRFADDEISNKKEDLNKEADSSQNKNSSDIDLTCRKCNANPACMPYKMPCGCVFCYFCLRTGLHERRGTNGEEMMYCLYCDTKITLPSIEEMEEMKRNSRSSRKKKVAIDDNGGEEVEEKEEEEEEYDYSTIAVRV